MSQFHKIYRGDGEMTVLMAPLATRVCALTASLVFFALFELERMKMLKNNKSAA